MSLSSVLSAHYHRFFDSPPKFSLHHPLSLFLLALSALFLFLALLLYIFQAKLVYLPQMPPGSTEEVWLPSRFGYGPGSNSKGAKGSEDSSSECSNNCKWRELEIVTKDKVRLQAFWIKAPSTWAESESLSESVNESSNEESTVKSRFNNSKNTSTTRDNIPAPFTLLYMQANAGNIGHRLPIARKLQETIDCNVLMLSYRGYGKSSGTPSESGIKLDSQAALDYVWNELLTSEEERSKVIVYGQSIGGAVAINLAHANPAKIRFLIVENTFLSIPKLIPRVAPLLRPFAFLFSERWNSAALVPQITQKALFLSGEADELIPADHMASLHRSARRSPHKQLVLFPKGTHNDTCIQPGYFEAIQDFLTKTPKTPRVTVEEVTDDEQEFMIKGKCYSDRSKASNKNNMSNGSNKSNNKSNKNYKKNK